MTDIDIIQIIGKVLESAKPECQISAIKTARLLIPKDQLELFDAVVDLKLSGLQDNPNSITVALIHGIQTDGAWQKLVQAEFRVANNINVVCVGYKFYNAIQLFALPRNGPVEKVKRELRDLRKREPKSRIMVIAHSFGSYIVKRILQEAPDIEFERIILCGSIVPTDFQWDVYGRGLDSSKVVNDVGTNDFWPVAATALSFGYGASGRLGFGTGRVSDRYFPFGHSDFFVPDHIKEFWLPFISDGRISKSDWDTKKPKTGLFINFLTNSSQAKLMVAIIIILILF